MNTYFTFILTKNKWDDLYKNVHLMLLPISLFMAVAKSFCILLVIKTNNWYHQRPNTKVLLSLRFSESLHCFCFWKKQLWLLSKCLSSTELYIYYVDLSLLRLNLPGTMLCYPWLTSSLCILTIIPRKKCIRFPFYRWINWDSEGLSILNPRPVEVYNQCSQIAFLKSLLYR